MKKIKLLRVIFLDTGIIESKRTSIYSSFRLSVPNCIQVLFIEDKRKQLKKLLKKSC